MDLSTNDTGYVSILDRMFMEQRELEYLSPDIIDLKIDPQHFIYWLAKEGDEDITGDYAYDCTSMCEYSCLYVAMMLHRKSYRGKLGIRYGSYGSMEHYWLTYQYEGEEYFIDLTLKQFIGDAPELSITRSKDSSGPDAYYYTKEEGEEDISVKTYLREKRGFDFYVDPRDMSGPLIKVDGLFDFLK